MICNVCRCDTDDCPFCASHFDRDMEYTKTGPIWYECLHPEGITLDYALLKKTQHVVPAGCPLRQEAITIKLDEA